MLLPGMTKAAMRAVVLGSCTALALTAVPAQAAPKNKLGMVKNLTAEITKPASYQIRTDWDDLAGATSYQVKLTVGGQEDVLRTTASEWTFRRANLASGTNVQVSVTPLKDTNPRRGRVATITVPVPDLVPPTGSFSVTVEENTGNATLTRTAVSDDVTAAGTIQQVVDWGDGSAPETVTGDVTPHTYEVGPAVYHPTVTLTDEAGNSAVLPLGPTPVKDAAPPTGTFTLGAPATVWADYTEVVLSQVEIDDDASANADIDRVVDWGDGTVEPWLGDVAPAHVFSTAGTRPVTVTLTDEAGKQTRVEVGAIEVTADEVAPALKVKKPAKRRSVKAWRTVRGTLVDAGVGADSVSVKVVQKRGKRWFAYRATTRNWVKATSKRNALRRSRAGVVSPVDAAWRMRIKNLRKGTLVVKARGTDHVGNVSRPVVRKQVLTRR